MLLAILLLFALTVLTVAAALFTYESVREQQPRASRLGMASIGVCCILIALVLFWPGARGTVAAVLGLGGAVFAIFLVPGRANRRARRGAGGYVVGAHEKVDERDIVFARNRSLVPGSEPYRVYYEELHPERKAGDDRRRALGGPLGNIGSIDGWRPNSAMAPAIGKIPHLLGIHAEQGPAPGQAAETLDPRRATAIVKGLAKHLGAVAVGVCKVDPRWGYSHRGEIHHGEWEEWGKELGPSLPYAVVFVTEMDHEMVGSSPHTPALVESVTNYEQGSVISTVLANWFSGMGYRGEAEHWRHYKHVLVPLAIDAGLGELGRFGYLITDKVGGRCRIAACLTDMPLEPDAPVDLGVEVFCDRCMKCADSCPSRSIPKGEKTVDGGRLLWKMDAESCFDYWGKIGTDCGICMAVCPFSRPNRSVHRVVRWILNRSPLAQRVFPHVDNLLYGKKWKPRRTYPWLDYSQR